MPALPRRPRSRWTTWIDLHRLILALTLCSALLPLLNTIYAGYLVQRQQLIESTLDSHYAYATKLARSTDDFLKAALQQLGYSAKQLSGHMHNPQVLLDEAARLHLQSNSFNSITILNDSGYVLATSPRTLSIAGKTISSAGVLEALAAKTPLISAPYQAATGNYIIFISQPIFAADGRYLGAIGGSIYLKQESMLDTLLGSHFYADGSYVFVVDRNQHIIYHPDTHRVGHQVQGNAAIDRVIQGESGQMELTNSQGHAMLAGYAVVPSTGWGIVAQRPLSITLAPLQQLMQSLIYKTLPIACLMLIVIWWSAHRIASPLRQLAHGAREMDQPETATKIQNIPSWYFEAQELKKAMLRGIGLLQRNITQLRADVNTDPLTGLGNRRHLEATVAAYQSSATPFAVLAIDIDHFKQVNDRFGHPIGDTVLVRLAAQMREISRSDDVPVRVGGEEFLLLLPHASLQAASQVAKRLNTLVASTDIPVAGRITISVGVSQWPHTSSSITTVFEQADAMLYAAKHAGRNQVKTAPSA